MKTLHSVVPALDPLDMVLWYGTGTQPCTNSYHRGYEFERPLSEYHEDCARTQFASLNNIGRERLLGYACTCDTCNAAVRSAYSNDPASRQPRHYFMFQHQGDDPLRASAYDEDGFAICWLCRQGRHPGNVPVERPQP